MASHCYDEKAALLCDGFLSPTYGCSETLKNKIEVKRLGHSDIPRAVGATYAASRAESLTRYFEDASRTPLEASRQKLFLALNYADGVHRGRWFTVDHGDATLSYREPGEEKAGRLLSWVLHLSDALKPAELRKREKEVGTKLRAMLKSVFGERVDQMMELSGLATSPAKQGRGYATALVRTLNDMADARGCAVWVFTDDAKWFYEELGYVLVAEEWAGVDNPKWKGDPVPLRVMLRKPKSGEILDVEKGLMAPLR